MKFKGYFQLSLLACVIGLLAGCTVGPKYARPNYPAPPAFRGADNAAVVSDAKTSLGDEQWAAVYREPELQELIRKALTNNYDLRIAAQRILEQQAQVKITRSQQFPTVNVGGTAIGATLPSSLRTQISSPFVSGAFNLSAAWTPDFWGLYRKQTEAARAQLLAQTWAQRAVRLTLVQQVATEYLQLRALDSQLEITKATLKVRQDSVDLTKTLESGGSVPLSDVRQAEQLLYAATSEIPQLEQQIQQEENAIAFLIGENPGPIRPQGSERACTSTAGSSNRLAVSTSRATAGYSAGRGHAGRGQCANWRGARTVLSQPFYQCCGGCEWRLVLGHLRPCRKGYLRDWDAGPAVIRGW